MPASPQFKYSEAGQPWEPLPKWVEWVLDVGYAWPSESGRQRRIAVISMPCDSAAAGILTLGALIHGLCRQNANDLDLHVDSLLSHAKQYLQHCKTCVQQPCAPEVRGCGFVAKAEGRMKLSGQPNKVYLVSEQTDFAERKIACTRNNLTWIPTGCAVASLYVYGMPQPQLTNPIAQLPPAPYRQIIPGAPILPQNLTKSYSGLCLAGRTGGENAARECIESIRFKDGVTEYGLHELLSIHGWSKLDVSRVSYFNARTGQRDRVLAQPDLLIADGDDAFLKVCGMPEFRGTDIIGVFNRTCDRDSLERVGTLLQNLRQWYQSDDDLVGMLHSAPRGISITIMQRKN